MTEVQHGVKIRIYPNQAQSEQLDFNFGAVRFLWNKMLDLYEARYRNNPDAQFLGEYDLNNLLPALKLEFPFLKDADSTSLQVTNKELSLAFKAFFKKVRKYPRFKSKKYPKQSYTTKSGSLKVIDDKHIYVPKFGIVKAKVTQDLKGKILNGNLKRTPVGNYYIVLIVREEKQALAKTKQVVGIDLGTETLVIKHTGEKYENIRFDLALAKKKHYWEKLLARRRDLMIQKKAEYQRETGKTLEDEDFKNYLKAKKMVAKYSEKVANQRRDYLQKLTTQLVRDYDEIHMEDLTAKKLLEKNRREHKHSLSRSIANASWGMIKQMLEYKAEWYGKT